MSKIRGVQTEVLQKFIHSMQKRFRFLLFSSKYFAEKERKSQRQNFATKLQESVIFGKRQLQNEGCPKCRESQSLCKDGACCHSRLLNRKPPYLRPRYMSKNDQADNFEQHKQMHCGIPKTAQVPI